MERLYKVVAEDGSAYYGGYGQWSLPTDGQPGEWMPSVVGKLGPCNRGYHLCRPRDLVYWLGPAIYEAEAAGKERLVVDGADGKVVVRRARLIRRLDNWTERTARLFAVECVERVLPIFERDHPNDKRPREALDVARRFANGEATRDELRAARVAARVAAVVAARDAAWAAAVVAAARAAARAAAGHAAQDAAWAAAQAAARAAAQDAAWAAARGAARVAAWAADGNADGNAAGVAEREWQTARLMELLGIAES